MRGQLEAFPPLPMRKLLVSTGYVDWWGVDPSTKRVAIASVAACGRRKSVVEAIPTLTGAQRLSALYAATVSACQQLALDPELAMPGVVIVEAPAGFGKRPNPELAYAAGAIMAALPAFVPQVHVELVVASRWKAQVCGDGAIAKPKPMDKREYAVLEWARAQGYTGSSWDAADAWAIAEYARRTFLLEPRHASAS